MIQSGQHLRLALESRHVAWVLREPLGQRLDGNIAAELGMGCR
jgi:hypothetical protein